MYTKNVLIQCYICALQIICLGLLNTNRYVNKAFFVNSFCDLFELLWPGVLHDIGKYLRLSSNDKCE